MKVFGEKIKRTEDPRFLRGDAKFIADIDHLIAEKEKEIMTV